jgi:hypothetical protein
MPTPITPVPTFDTPLTVAGTDSPNSAGMLEVLQTHANRAEYLYQMRRRAVPMRFFNAPAMAAVVHERAGSVILYRSANYDLVPLVAPDLASDNGFFGAFAVDFTMGAADGAAAHGAYDGAERAVIVCGQYCQHFDVTLHCQRYALASITTARDVVWTPYNGGRFVAVGGVAGPEGRINLSADGVTWTESANGSSTANAWGKVATDPTGKYVLVAPLDGIQWAYSSDGGVTWNRRAISAMGADAYTVTGLAYDTVGARWVLTLDSEAAELVGQLTRVWALVNPLADALAAIGTAVPTRGPHTPYRAWGIAVVGSEWFVGACELGGGYGDGNVVVTRDGGATWEEAWGLGNGAAYGIQLRRSGGYLVFGNDTYLHAISERLAP